VSQKRLLALMKKQQEHRDRDVVEEMAAVVEEEGDEEGDHEAGAGGGDHGGDGAGAVSERAKANARAGNLEGALTLFRRASEIEPDVASHLSNCGATLVHLGRRGEARECFKGAIALEPENDQVRAQMKKYGEEV
jgi:tetratricopeptide (TPR) repeat protein